MSFSRREWDRQIARLKVDNKIAMEKQGSTPLPKASLKSGLDKIRNTNWFQTNPTKMLEVVTKMKEEKLQEDLLHKSRLFTAAFIPFTDPFPELSFMIEFPISTSSQNSLNTMNYKDNIWVSSRQRLPLCLENFQLFALLACKQNRLFLLQQTFALTI